MTSPIPKISKQWTITTDESGSPSLEYNEAPIPDIGDTQVLVKIHAASLNYRDILILQNKYPFPLKPSTIPGSDGAGTVLKVGKHVTRFQPGDKVLTLLHPHHIAGPLTPRIAQFALGATLDGTFRSIGAFDEQGLVNMPQGLSFIEAATLSCAGVTGWNAVFGSTGVGAGQWIVTQGSGGVSVFVLQFAKVVGARVIGITGSGEKAEFLKRLGADYVINYNEVGDWGDEVKKLTNGVGVDLVVDVAGAKTLGQSMRCLRMDGTVSVVGFVGGEAEGIKMPSLLDCWINFFTARGVWVGSRMLMEDMCRAIEGNLERLRPVVDRRVFKLAELREAYTYLAEGKHRGKVCIEIGD